MELVRVQDSDYRKTYELYMSFPENENGYMNNVYGYSYEQFLEWIEKKRNWSLGKNLPEGFVPDTTYVLVDEDVYVGVFNLRHCLNDFLREGPGHIGYCISKKYRGKGYATKGLELTLTKAWQMCIHEVYMSVNKDNPASLRVQIKNGAYIHHENEKEYFTRVNAVEEGTSREEIINKFYSQYEEEERLERTVHGRLEYTTTMNYIHRYADKKSKVLEIGEENSELEYLWRKTMISLKVINEDNFVDAFNLKLAKGQEEYVSHPVRSLAQAYVYRNQCQPFGIYADEKMVGYVMVIYDYDVPEYDIWHMMIDESQQGKGYGRAALNQIIEYIKAKPFGDSSRIALTCNKNNYVAKALYENIGFSVTGVEDEDEIELVMNV